VAEGNLAIRNLETDDRFVTAVMVASGGYPGHYEKGKVISGLQNTSDCVVFHAGTKLSDGRVMTSGGRVLAVSSWGKSMQDALDGSYRNAARITFENMYFRPDIGFDLKDK
jgi:phosphoribosylamine--glycine ligase